MALLMMYVLSGRPETTQYMKTERQDSFSDSIMFQVGAVSICHRYFCIIAGNKMFVVCHA